MPSRQLFLIIYLVSGAAALLYEVAWSRLLTLHMGHTVAAVGTVLAAFMAGLALGAAVMGRPSSSLTPRRALEVYAALEVAIGTFALLVPVALLAMRPLLAWAYADGEGGALFGVTRVVSSLVLVTIPACAMGATFPVAVRWFVGDVSRAGAHAGALYTLNSIGAAVGAALAGFVLMPTLGLRGTTFVGAAMNVTAGAGAWWLARREAIADPALSATPVPSAPPAAIAKDRPRKRSRPRHAAERTVSPLASGRPWVAAAVLGVSGFVALAFEVAWTRILALVLGPTTYAFSTMLAAFIAGIALGSGLASRLVSRFVRPIVPLGVCLMLAALGALVAVRYLHALPLTIARAVADPGAGFSSVMVLQASLIAALLMPMTLALGAAFPFAVAVAARREGTVSLDVAIVYTVNTIGAILGALAGSFVLVPLLGLYNTLFAAAGIAVITGLALVITSGGGLANRLAGAGVGVVALALAVTSPSWDRELMSSGAYKYAPYIESSDLQTGLEAGQLLYYDEGAAGTIAVRNVAGTTSMSIDGKVDASNAGDMLTQNLLAHLPLLLHPNPETVAIIGLGSGVTLGAALHHPVERVDMLEISKEVVEASAFFQAENHDALSDPRTRLIVGDGRTHLMLSSQQYDVIISEPSNPWMAGVATLFTQEFFAAARARLAPGGLLCQWAHTYDISPADLRSIVATFLSVFPQGSAWLVGEGDLLLIGGPDPVVPMIEHIRSQWARPGVAADLAAVGVHEPFCLLSLFVASGDDLRRYAGDGIIQTDDRTSLEFSAPRGIYGRGGNANPDELLEVREASTLPAPVQKALSSATAAQWRNRGLMMLAAEAWSIGYDDLARAVRLDPTDVEALEGLARAAAAARRMDAATELLQQLAAAHPQNVPLRVTLSRLLASQGHATTAIEVAAQALDVDPANGAARAQLASIYADAGDVDALEPVVARMNQERPDDVDTLYYDASLHFLRGDFERAAALGERVVAADPGNAKAHNLLGGAYANLGRLDDARDAFQASVRVNPKDATTYVNLGVFELSTANPGAAATHFAEALAIDPSSLAALNGLAEALEQQGQSDRAERLRRTQPGRS